MSIESTQDRDFPVLSFGFWRSEKAGVNGKPGVNILLGGECRRRNILRGKEMAGYKNRFEGMGIEKKLRNVVLCRKDRG